MNNLQTNTYNESNQNQWEFFQKEFLVYMFFDIAHTNREIQINLRKAKKMKS